jgi:hypothetical protein
LNRGVDRTWGLMLSLGVVQAGLGFYVSSPWARTADVLIVTLGAVGVLRSVADLVTALRLREVSVVRPDILELSPEREAGMSGYAAGLTDFESGPSRARHRAGAQAGPVEAEPRSFHDEVVRTTRDLDTMIAEAGVTGSPMAAHRVPAELPRVPDTAAEVSEEAQHRAR